MISGKFALAEYGMVDEIGLVWEVLLNTFGSDDGLEQLAWLLTVIQDLCIGSGS